MMTKKHFNCLLMAAVVLGLSMSVASCKDDDKDDKDGSQVIAGETTMEMTLTDDEAVLASLLRSFCDFDAQDASSGLLNKTFVPTVGDVADESQPFVRTIVMGTQENADAYASTVLSVLGSGNNPVGFSWQNDAIGNISYAHGSGNELGVLTLGIKQIPSLTKIRLTKDADGNVRKGEPYYHRGDIIKYSKDGKLYLCVSSHKYDENSRWISFDGTEEEFRKQSKGTCSWSGVGKDSVFNAPQASSATLAEWMEFFLFNDENYQTVIDRIEATKKNDNDPVRPLINQLVPDDALHNTFIEDFTIALPASKTVLEAWKIMGDEDFPRSIMMETIPDTKGRTNVTTYLPQDLVLANTMRWSMGFTFDYWVPYLVLTNCNEEEATKFEDMLNATASQNSGKFKWKLERTFNSANYYNDGTYRVYTVALHWTHDKIENRDKNAKASYGVLHFTSFDKDRDGIWMGRCITSHEITYTDKGAKNSKFESIYIEEEQ